MSTTDPADVRALADALYVALHEQTDGDFLVGASRWRPGEDVGLSEAGMHEVITWAVDAVLPVIAEREKRIRAETLAEVVRLLDEYALSVRSNPARNLLLDYTRADGIDLAARHVERLAREESR